MFKKNYKRWTFYPEEEPREVSPNETLRLISLEVIDELAKLAGVETKVKDRRSQTELNRNLLVGNYGQRTPNHDFTEGFGLDVVSAMNIPHLGPLLVACVKCGFPGGKV